MYKIPKYREDDHEAIMEFMRSHPFALITGAGIDGKPIATQVPVLIDEEDGQLILSGHVMRGSDHWQGFSANADVLAVFSGPNCPVSASWYTGIESASTWNYMAVHARGSLQMIDQDGLINVLTRLTRMIDHDPNVKAQYVDLPEDYVSRLLPAIQAFTITVTNLDAIFKLSQNHTEENYDNIISKLGTRGRDSAEISEIMAARRERFFPISPP